NFLFASGPNQLWNWRWQILPYIEQANLFNQPTTVTNATLRASPVPLYNCPARRPPTLVGTQVLSADYACNATTNWCLPTDAATWNGVIIPGKLNNGTPLPPVRLTSITDGTSNTLMLGEKFVPSDLYSAATAWGDNNPWPTGAD